MNLHPILVHFPIALFTIYSVFELIRFKKVMAWEPWFYMKAGLVILGSASSIITFLSGEVIEPQFAVTPKLMQAVSMHSSFAFVTIVLYLVIAFAYHAVWLKWKPAEKIAKCILSAPVIIPLSLIGLILVSVTAAIGGGIAFGTNIDPFVTIVYQLLGL